ncbi:5'-methylthioadenosine/S-adenosylhomocysteine nucleosidase family protein [Kitasatospora sp. NBC_00458]|uniref:5'-methylthioadenosine/S-adenosylhomocysteine nucleosidase family protein n=1 Tax=Kitasatospora sp. NBC_00458 TaxID=2903568 RepID=UPI002E19E511
MTERRTGTAVVLTALPVEYRAVRGLLGSTVKRQHPSGTVFVAGVLPGTRWEVVLARVGEGNLRAAVLAERAHQWLGPDALFFVGVAGGLKPDVRIGDVVVATKVHHLHPGKDSADGFLARPVPGAVSHLLEQNAWHALSDDSWFTSGSSERPGSPVGRGPVEVPAVHFKPVVAGEVVLNAPGSPLREQIRWHYDDAVAVEMESAGVAAAASLGHDLHILTVRGISDHADGEKAAADATGSQDRAAANAAAALAAILRDLDPDDLPPRGPDRAVRPGADRDAVRPAAGYGGDHIDFRHGTFLAPVVGKADAGPTARPPVTAPEPTVPGAVWPDAVWVEALLAFGDMARAAFRQDVLTDMGRILDLPHPFLAAEYPVARDHVREIVGRVNAYKDAPAARAALHRALESARPDDRALVALSRLLP